MSAKGKTFDDLKRLQDRFTKRCNRSSADNEELLSDLLTNIRSQWMLLEWQELLQTEQKILVDRIEKNRQSKR
jgi:hypothetical protein